ncbi:MAG: TonB-dependent receptor [Moraxellaceae bacterium]
MNTRSFRLNPILIGLLSTLVAPAFADTTDTQRLPTIQVVADQGDTDAIAQQTGAVSIVSAEQIEMIQPRSTEDILKRVPGVYVKPEEESAIVVNVGIRGLSSADYKTTVLEDGVPVAAGLFVGNARYYNPRASRIDSVEVLKGSAALRYGPGNIGGVINYRTKQPKDGVSIDTSIGSWDTYKTSVELGGSSPNKDSVFGAILSHEKSDGFMGKGYESKDAVIKAGTAIGDNQTIGVKFTHYENDANISYRGVFLDEFNNKSDRNPAPDDYFLTERNSFDINHRWDIADGMRLDSLFYWSEMNRDYWRFATNNTASAATKRWVYTDSLNGNNRSFKRYGAETRLTADNQLAGISGEAEVGLRYLTEKMFDQTINATRATPRTGVIGKDVIDSAESFAIYAQNRFDLTEQLSITPALRVERYSQARLDLTKSQSARTDNTEVMPGLGATFQVNPAAQVYASVYQAFSPALNADSLDGLKDQQLDAEKSINVEIGVRGAQDQLNYELTVFRMDFDNQIVPANSNTNFQTTNGGKTLHQGLEAAVGYDFDNGLDVFANATWIADAEFSGDRFAANGVTLTTPDGNRIPYTPEWVANIGVAYEINDWRTQLSAHYMDSQFTDVRNTTTIAENTSGFFTGQLDAYTTVDLTSRYQFNPQLEVYGSIKNLLDEHYMASLRNGIYVGPERSFETGVKYRF